jgi:protein SCO1/2
VFQGRVLALDRNTGLVNIDHEEIPGVMPAMAMDFQPRDRGLLEDVEVGDEVEGVLEVSFGPGGRIEGLELTSLVVTRPAVGMAPEPERVPELKVGEPVPDVLMTGSDGQEFRLSELRGKIVALTFVYTRCPLPNFCPLMDRNFLELQGRVTQNRGRLDRVRLVSLSIDPAHDQPAVLAAHAKRVGAKAPVWRYAVATPEELYRIAGPSGLTYFPVKGEFSHSLSTLVIGGDGRLARLWKGNGWTVAEVIRSIDQLMEAQAD